MYDDVRFSPQATKFFRKLPVAIQQRIRTKFTEVSKDPFRYIEHYEGDHYKIRIGDYRALVDIDQTRAILWVRVFDKRGRIYK
jgi:mRNA-degrading endonuclease RelE of RelBE toxin-antitoxin system